MSRSPSDDSNADNQTALKCCRVRRHSLSSSELASQSFQLFVRVGSTLQAHLHLTATIHNHYIRLVFPMEAQKSVDYENERQCTGYMNCSLRRVNPVPCPSDRLQTCSQTLTLQNATISVTLFLRYWLLTTETVSQAADKL
jgi:hypothetical protein